MTDNDKRVLSMLILVVVIGLTIFFLAVALRPAHAQSRQTPLYDKDGHYSGSVINNGNGTTTYTDRDGKFSGSAIDNRNGTTSFYGPRGNFSGSFDQLIVDALREAKDAEIAFSPGFRWGTSLLPGETITLERLMDQTAITYPQVVVSQMSGETIKSVLEDVCDNLFNPDPYYQQGGDMVRVGGLAYTIDPAAKIGQRILDMRLDGKPLEADKIYKVAGWAPVAEGVSGEPIWNVVATYLRAQKVIQPRKVNTPALRGMSANPGIVKA